MRNEYDNNLINSDKIFGVGEYRRDNPAYLPTMVYGSPESNRISGAIVLGLIGFGLYWLGGILARFGTFDFPYNIIAAFYNFAFVVPVKTFPIVWTWLAQLRLTSWDNFNLVISVVGIGFYGLLVLSVYTLILDALRKKGADGYTVFSIIAMPAMLGFFWFVIASTLGWLFS